MPDYEWVVLLAALLVTILGTVVQAALGFGLALVAAPVLHLLNPGFVPAPVIVCVWTLSLWVFWQERKAVDLDRIPVLAGGRLLGAVLAVSVLGGLSAATFDLVFGTLVLLAVMLSWLHPQLQANSRNIFIATLASGFMGTMSGIGGPPLALVYQNAGVSRLRANMALVFLIGASMSLLLLAWIGRFGWQEVRLGLWLQPGVLAGILLARPLRRRLDPHHVRPLLLALCSLAALIILVRGVLNSGFI
ncbi:MAG TPA: sulfite exporter TauE/SafE family protein [Pseudomonadaceae bacterium]|nr:sulfite exporter TauE/SafE family protein [Pseudomonadaceae bacterium]